MECLLDLVITCGHGMCKNSFEYDYCFDMQNNLVLKSVGYTWRIPGNLKYNIFIFGKVEALISR